jgi:hypothetical protein
LFVVHVFSLHLNLSLCSTSSCCFKKLSCLCNLFNF